MKLVLIPGMDGTGILFEDVISELGEMNIVAISLPDVGEQDYESLSEYVASKLPSEDFILIAESFSGGIAAVLSRRDISSLKGIIFVASFLSSPKPLFASIASFLPVCTLAQLPLANWVHRILFLGWAAGDKKLSKFKRAVQAVSNQVLQSRLKVIANSQYDGFKSSVPAVYIIASQDKLVPRSKVSEFKRAYPSITIVSIEGPHFILQAQPKAGAAAIIEAAHLLTRQFTHSGPSGLHSDSQTCGLPVR